MGNGKDFTFKIFLQHELQPQFQKSWDAVRNVNKNRTQSFAN